MTRAEFLRRAQRMCAAQGWAELLADAIGLTDEPEAPAKPKRVFAVGDVVRVKDRPYWRSDWSNFATTVIAIRGNGDIDLRRKDGGFATFQVDSFDLIMTADEAKHLFLRSDTYCARLLSKTEKERDEAMAKVRELEANLASSPPEEPKGGTSVADSSQERVLLGYVIKCGSLYLSFHRPEGARVWKDSKADAFIFGSRVAAKRALASMRKGGVLVARYRRAR